MHSLTAAIQVVLKYMLRPENCQVADGMYRQLLFKPKKCNTCSNCACIGFKTQTKNKQKRFVSSIRKANEKHMPPPLAPLIN